MNSALDDYMKRRGNYKPISPVSKPLSIVKPHTRRDEFWYFAAALILCAIVSTYMTIIILVGYAVLERIK